MNEKYVIPEIHSNSEWYYLTGRKALISQEDENKIKSKKLQLDPVKEHQVLLIDVFTYWSGPCIGKI